MELFPGFFGLFIPTRPLVSKANVCCRRSFYVAKSDACLIVREARHSPHSHSFLELLKFRLLAGDRGTYRPIYERWFTPNGRLMTFITSCPHSRAPAFPSAKSSISAYQMSVTVFLLLLDFCSSPRSTLIPGTDCNSPCWGFSSDTGR